MAANKRPIRTVTEEDQVTKLLTKLYEDIAEYRKSQYEGENRLAERIGDISEKFVQTVAVFGEMCNQITERQLAVLERLDEIEKALNIDHSDDDDRHW